MKINQEPFYHVETSNDRPGYSELEYGGGYSVWV